MKKHLASFLQGVIVAALAAFWFERRRRGIGASEGRYLDSLLDLNQASKEELAALPGLDAELVGRIIENRPYRNKLDLLSRLVIAEETYEAIKPFVHVPPEAATEPVKVATG